MLGMEIGSRPVEDAGRLLSVKMRTKLDYSRTPYTKSTANRLKISMKGQIL